MTAPVLIGEPQAWARTLQDYLAAVDNRLARLEIAQAPAPVFAMVSASLSTANAATYAFTQVFATDLKTLAVSDGAHWYRADTGGTIV